MFVPHGNRTRCSALLVAASILVACVIGIADPAAAAAAPTIKLVNTSLSVGTLAEKVVPGIKGISVADADSPSLDLHLTVTGGVLATRPTVTLSTTSGLVFTLGGGTASTDMVFHGTIAQINAALDGLVITGGTAAGAYDLVITVDDSPGASGGLSLTKSMAITVSALAPTVTDPADISVATSTSKVLTGAAALKVADGDSPILDLRLQVVGGTAGHRPTFTLDGVAGLTIRSGAATASEQVSITGSVASINAALDGMSIAAGDTAAPHSLGVTVDDAPGTTGGQAMTIGMGVLVTDDAPTVSAPATAKLGGGVPRSIVVSAGDPDSPKLDVTLAITPDVAGAPTFSGGPFSGLTATGLQVDSRQLKLTGTIQNLGVGLSTLTFKGGATLGGGHTLTVTVDDAPGAPVGNVTTATTALTVVQLPSAPTGVTASARAGSALVTWTAPATVGASPITGYKVMALRDGAVVATTSTITTDTSVVAGGLTDGEPVTFVVAAITLDGVGSVSAPSNEVTPQVFFPFASAGAEVDRLYQDVLGRPPSGAERSAAVNGLLDGTLFPSGLVRQLRELPESTANVDPVTRLYRAYFLRIPDVPGLRFWITKRRGGASLDSISQTFANSSEFKNRYGTLADQAFVELVFQNVLGRPGDAGGIAFWTNQLATKARTRGQVMIGFSESNEYKTKQFAEVEVSVQYISLLGRAPTAAEFAQKVSEFDTLIATTQSLAFQILRSDEWIAHVS